MIQASQKKMLCFCLIILMLSVMQIADAADLILIIDVNEYYNLGDPIIVNGTLTLDGSPVEDALVAIQIKNPNETILVRTLTTGTTPSEEWQVELLEVIPCDSEGDPQSSFARGQKVHFEVWLQNNSGSNKTVLVTVCILYSNGIPAFLRPWNETFKPGPPESNLFGFELPDNAPTGTTVVYASALEKTYPENNGHAFCPEKSATFSITAGGKCLSTASNTSQETGFSTKATPGTFSMSFTTSDAGGILGNYTVYSRARISYFPFFASDIPKTFEVVLITDLNGDAIVNMKDVYIVIKAFRSQPGDPNWNPKADINKDGIVNMKDVYAVIKDFGKWGQY